MRILFSLDKYTGHEGGSDRSARSTVQALLAAGHAVRVLEAGPEAQEDEGRFTRVCHPLPSVGWLRDNDLTTLRANVYWSDVLDEEMGAYRPHMVLTQNMLTPASVAAARRASVPSAILFHGYRPLSPVFFQGQDALTCDPPSFWNLPLRHKLKWPLVAKTLEFYRAAYTAADRVIANSEYTAKVTERFFKRPAEVLYPIVDQQAPDDPLPAKPNGAILFVKPQTIKGVDVVIRTAQQMPERSFVVAGSASRRTVRKLRCQRNIAYRGWLVNKDELYAGVSLLFGPSQIPEPFGQVFIEAGLRGIPAVASNAGGIPESAGDGGILVDMLAPIRDWTAAIRQALEPDQHARLSAAARHHALALLETHNQARVLQVLGLTDTETANSP